MRYRAIQAFIWDTVEADDAGHRVSRAFDQFIIGLILVNVVAVILDTIPEVHTYYGVALYDFERFSVSVFTLEYLLRVWACAADPRFSKPVTGRLRFMATPMAVIDLLAIVPFYLPMTIASGGLAPILRLLRLAKLGRYYESLNIIRAVVKEKREELLLTGAIMGVLLVVSSTMMYFVEHVAQPEAYRSVPDTMWWAVATLTTVGYGDVTPVTGFGKMFASVISLLGIGMFALPTAILGSGFIDVMRRRRGTPRCPHCKKSLVSGPRWSSEDDHEAPADGVAVTPSFRRPAEAQSNAAVVAPAGRPAANAHAVGGGGLDEPHSEGPAAVRTVLAGSESGDAEDVPPAPELDLQTIR